MGLEAMWPFIGLGLFLAAGSWAYKIAQNGIENHERWPLAMSLVMGGIGAVMAIWPEGQHVVSWLLIIAFGAGLILGLYIYVRSHS